MKEIIVASVMLIILLIFPLQNMRDTAINSKLEAFDIAVHNSVNIARTDGYFTPTNISNLRNTIQNIFPDVTADEIIINVTTTPKYRTSEYDERELIHYEIAVPVKNVILMGDYLGIPRADNQFMYGKRSFVPSERLP